MLHKETITSCNSHGTAALWAWRRYDGCTPLSTNHKCTAISKEIWKETWKEIPRSICMFLHGTFNQLWLQLHSPQSTKCHLIKYSRLWMISKKSRKMCFSMAFPDNLVCYSDTRPRGVRGIGFSNTGKCIPTFNPVVRSCWISSKNVNFSLAASISLARCMI